MAIGQQCYQQRVNKMLLPNDCLIHPFGDELYEIVLARHEVVQLSDVNGFAHKMFCRFVKWLVRM